MSTVRTAMGRTLDMAALIQKNEKTRAVSNLSVNARGDTIDSTGKVIETANQRVAKHYNGAVGNKSARAKPTERKVIPKQELSASELELQEQLDQEDQDLENLKKD